MSLLRSARGQIGAALVVAALAGLTAVAGAGDSFSGLKIGSPKLLSIHAAAAVERSCEGRLDAGQAGVVQRLWKAPQSGYLTVRLGSPAVRGDWDLAVFGRDGRRLGASQAYRANEVVQGAVENGERLTLQACRRSGKTSTVALSTQLVPMPVTNRPAIAKVTEVAVKLAGEQTIDQIRGLGLEVTHNVRDGEAHVLAYGGKQLDLLRGSGLQFRTVVDDLYARERIERAKDEKYTRQVGAGGSALPSGRTEYRTYEEFQSELKDLVAKYPDKVRAVTMPKQTFQGRDTIGIEIAANVNKADGRPVFGLIGMHHAREWPAAEVPLEFAYELLVNPRKDARVTQVLKKTRVVIVPIINGDGYISSRTAPIDPDPDGETLVVPAVGNVNLVQGVAPPGGLLTYRRKNCNGIIPSNAVPCELQTGVDPNRNYGSNWGGKGASTFEIDQDYRGTGPWSETETQAVHEWSQRLNMTTFITMHNVAALVLRPPGVSTAGKAPDEVAMKALGDAMAKATGYVSQFGFELYDTTGTTEDWNYAAAGTYGYTIEIGPTSGEFHHNYKKGVADEYLGKSKRAGLGLREALLLTAEAASSAKDHSRLVLRAPAGRMLRIKKTFQTATSPVCQVAQSIVGRQGAVPNIDGVHDAGCFLPSEPQLIDDFVEYTTVMPRNTKSTWWMPPSTRPFVGKDGKTEAYTLTCERDGRVIQARDVTLRRGQALKVTMKCGGKLPKEKKAKKKKRKRR